ncbi:MAG: hypothetical protein AB1324_05260 [Candidatus Micrarchaeota archaeon]
MEGWLFTAGLIGAAGSFVATIVLSLAVRAVGERAERLAKPIALFLFLVLGFSIVPVFVGLFVAGAGHVIPVPLDWLEKNDTLIVLVFWAVFLLGLIVAYPAMVKDGFFGPEREAGGGRPKGPTWPPLDYQIKHASAIMLAKTMDDGAYEVLGLWKAPAEFLFQEGSAALIETKSFRLLGYEPKTGQEVVFFFMNRPPYNEPIELLPVEEGRVVFAPGDATVREEMAPGELKARVRRLIKG